MVRIISIYLKRGISKLQKTERWDLLMEADDDWFSLTMRGVWLTGHGGMDKLEIRQDIPVPVPGPRDVLVRVAAAGVNNTDINTRTAWY